MVWVPARAPDPPARPPDMAERIPVSSPSSPGLADSVSVSVETEGLTITLTVRALPECWLRAFPANGAFDPVPVPPGLTLLAAREAAAALDAAAARFVPTWLWQQTAAAAAAAGLEAEVR